MVEKGEDGGGIKLRANLKICTAETRRLIKNQSPTPLLRGRFKGGFPVLTLRARKSGITINSEYMSFSVLTCIHNNGIL